MSTKLAALYEDAFAAIEDAKKYKNDEQFNLAYDLYLKGIEHFMQITKAETDHKKKETIKRYLHGFMKDAEHLQSLMNKNKNAQAAHSNAGGDVLNLPDPPQKSITITNNNNNNSADHGGGGGGCGDDGDNLFDRAQNYLNEAIAFDQEKRHVEALEKYKFASQLFLDALKTSDASAHALSKADKIKYRDKVSNIVDRCELLSKLITRKQQQNGASRGTNSGVANEALSTKEIQVLRSSSFIRNLQLLPWITADERSIVVRSHDDEDDDDDAEMYRDAHGLLALSAKQKAKFGKWKRIRNVCKHGKPSIVSLVTPYSITQTLIADCSFVASLTVTALYEKIFSKKLISSIIYPQDSSRTPVYNSQGKYAVQLFINGCSRKVVIDDYLPVASDGRLLCSFSNNPNEFWVSLIEKAFLKVMGGYDFPGSTSCEDLHVLTGWIPERIGFHDDDEKKTFDADRVFDRLVQGMKFGDCLLTLSSNAMTDEKADAVGLVPTHAYAVLRVERLGAHMFMLLKNPWASKRWKGRFGAHDTQNWTPQLREALSYNPEKEQQFDNGIFWVSFIDVMQYFSAVFLNWNPELFAYRVTQHGFWSKTVGPKNDGYNLGYNPQFTLDVEIADQSNNKNSESNSTQSVDGGSVWILLSKHMEASKRHEQDKNDFLTLHVYDESKVNTRDRRVFHRAGALYTGVYINSPHYLMRIDVDKQEAKQALRRYSIIISQYEKKHDVSFTITAYSTLMRTRFRPIDDTKSWPYQKTFMAKWDKNYCGGSPNHDSFPQNPQFKITTFVQTHLRFILEAPVKFSVNIQLYLCVNDDNNADEQSEAVAISNYDDENANLDEDDAHQMEAPQSRASATGRIVTRKHYSKDLLVGDSGAYRPGVCMLDALNVEQGTYIAIISTFQPQQIGGFKFQIKSVENLQLKIV